MYGVYSKRNEILPGSTGDLELFWLYIYRFVRIEAYYRILFTFETPNTKLVMLTLGHNHSTDDHSFVIHDDKVLTKSLIEHQYNKDG